VQFNYYDARVRLNQSVLDLVKIRNVHSASENLQAHIHAARDSRDLIVLAVAGSYLQLIGTQARVEAAKAQTITSQAISKQAQDRLDAGLATRVDVTRSQVQLQTEQERLRSLRADLDTQKLRLARIIGLAGSQHFEIADTYSFAPVTNFTLDSALQKAFQNRSDLLAAAASVRAAEASVKAAHAEYLPSLSLTGDFGAAGITPTHESTGVYTATGTLSIPIYEGGRIHGDIEQAGAAVRQRKAEMENLRGQVDQDVRQAFIDLDAAADQVIVAKSNVELAHQTLTQSRDRFTAGVTDTVEVVQ
jgi:outer membrane protein TolC